MNGILGLNMVVGEERWEEKRSSNRTGNRRRNKRKRRKKVALHNIMKHIRDNGQNIRPQQCGGHMNKLHWWWR